MSNASRNKITVCYFGIFDPEYSRNRIFIKGLKKLGVTVLPCVSTQRGVVKYFDLIRKHWNMRHQYDVMVVGYPGQQSTVLAHFLTRKPIILDALVSLYDSMVDDRAVISRRSIYSFYYWCIDYLSCHLADKVLVDTYAHREYFIQSFRLRGKKIERIFIGSDDEEVYPLPSRPTRTTFKVHFHGCFNPLQGVEVIVKAAKLLENEDIKFTLIGTGQTFDSVYALSKKLNLHNISFLDRVPYHQLKEYLAGADASLGIFGVTKKALRVIPNKVYEALASRTPIITGRTPGITELLTDRENVLLCEVGDEEDLASKIQEIRQNEALRMNIAKRGYELFISTLTPLILSKQLLSVIDILIHEKSGY